MIEELTVSETMLDKAKLNELLAGRNGLTKVTVTHAFAADLTGLLSNYLNQVVAAHMDGSALFPVQAVQSLSDETAAIAQEFLDALLAAVVKFCAVGGPLYVVRDDKRKQ